jgi:hypothetical protein
VFLFRSALDWTEKVQEKGLELMNHNPPKAEVTGPVHWTFTDSVSSGLHVVRVMMTINTLQGLNTHGEKSCRVP